MTTNELLGEGLTTETPETDEAQVAEEVDGVADEGSADSEQEPKQPEKPEEPKADQQAKLAAEKSWRDAANSARGEASLMARIVKQQIDEGLLSEDEIAEKLNTDVKTIKRIISGRGVENPVGAQAKVFDSQYQVVRGVLSKTLGQDADELVNAYKWYAQHNQEELDNFVTVDEGEVVSYVIEKGRELLEDYKEAQQQGGDLVALVKKLRAENKALRDSAGGGSGSQPTAKPEVKTPPAAKPAQASNVSNDRFSALFT